jgi:hypothetical protein
MSVSIHWWKHEARSRADHVTESLNSESPYSRYSVPTSFRESYLFHSLNLEACSLHLIEWNRTDTVERWIDMKISFHIIYNKLFFDIASIIAAKLKMKEQKLKQCYALLKSTVNIESKVIAETTSNWCTFQSICRVSYRINVNSVDQFKI